jgi:phospholipase/carboxylesterase
VARRRRRGPPGGVGGFQRRGGLRRGLDPSRFAGAALLYGTIPFDAGVATTPERLAGGNILHAQGVDDQVIPRDLMSQSWQYLTEESGANLETYCTTGGHAIAPKVLAALNVWLEKILVVS